VMYPELDGKHNSIYRVPDDESRYRLISSIAEMMTRRGNRATRSRFLSPHTHMDCSGSEQGSHGEKLATGHF
jgi:hypothetical protein